MDSAACPCKHTVPCHPNCTCVKQHMSRGCQRCCTYGSPEQQKAKAERLATLLNKAEKAQKYAQELLLTEMSGISELVWCAGWLHNLEYILWDCVLDRKSGKKITLTSRYDAIEAEQEKAMQQQGIAYAVGDQYHKAVKEEILTSLDKIIELSEVAEGWWIGGTNATQFNNVFLSMKDWKKQYAASDYVAAKKS